MLRLVVGLAARDCLYDRRLFVCFAAAFAAVLAPLLVVYGLKYGIIDHLIGTLTEDPRNREVVGIVNRSFDAAWFERMRARPEVAFVIPRTRTLAATAFLDRPGPATGRSVTAELIPTAAGDPMLGAPASLVDARTIVVSQSAARRLGVAAGDPLTFWVVRDSAGARERVDVAVTVAAVAPSAVFQRDAAFVSLPLLTAVEDWREGRAVPAFGWEGTPPPQARVYAGYRLFARSIFDVAQLEADLQREGLEVRTRAAEIESIVSLDRNLSLIFLVVAGIALAGYTLSLGASLWANVERKRREISVIRLIGVPRGAARAFPMVQAVLIAAAGLAGAIAVYGAAAIALNTLYAGDYVEGAQICRLTGVHLAIAAAGSLAIGVIASAIAAARVVRIEPSEGLRDE
jgi:putative ABC transport system permease protein